MVLSNAERQQRYREKLKQSAYEMNLLRKQVAELEQALNEARRHVGLSEVQISKSAYDPHR